MFKSLNPNTIGISGRQSELIELALTFRFQGLEFDLIDFQRRAEQQGLAQARRLLDSAKLRLTGFDLPFSLGADDATYCSQLAQLEPLAQLAASLGAQRCWALLEPASDERPYHDNFETHRKRLPEVCAVLDKHNIRLGLGIRAAEEHRREKAFQFIYQPDQLLTLVRTAGVANLGVVIDLWDWQVGGGTLDQAKAVAPAQVLALRLADLPADCDPATVTEQQRLVPACSPEVAGILTRLAEGQYDGPVTALPHPSQLAGLKRDAAVRAISTSIDQLWQAAGLDKSGRLAPATAN